MKETVTLKELFQTLKKRIWLIALTTIVIATLTAIVSFFVLTPIYEAKTQLLVNQVKSEEQFYNSGEVQTNIQLINTYSLIIKSPAILEKVKDDLNLDMAVEDLNEKIEVSSAKDSQIVEITVQDESPHVAAKIANKTSEVFQKNISKIMKVDNVSILAPAVVKEDVSPVKPQPFLNIGVAIFIGLVLGIGLTFLLDYLDNTIKSEQDIENLLGIPIMGVITSIEEVPNPASRVNRTVSPQNARGETYGS